MNIGYARVSTGNQTLNLQLDALKAAGCERIFEETASGTKADWIILNDAIAYARSGDVLVVWRLDRLGRSLQHLLTTVTELAEWGIGSKSLTEQIDTTTPGGKLVFHLFDGFAEFECGLIPRAREQQLPHPKTLALTSELDESGQTPLPPFAGHCKTMNARGTQAVDDKSRIVLKRPSLLKNSF